MAIPGTGARRANDVLIEISLHLVITPVITTLSAPVTPGVHTVVLASVANIYIGALLVVDTGSNAEVITVTGVSPSASTITANFANSHSSGVPVSAATFPLQQATDPVFTQAEMLGYLSRAENEFLERVPCIYQIFQQTALAGSIVQPLPGRAIEMNRVSASEVSIPATSLTRTGGVVAAVWSAPHGLAAGQSFQIQNAPDPSFNGVFQVLPIPLPGASTFSYNQAGSNASTNGGNLQIFERLYELTQQELTLDNRQWRQMLMFPTSWFEDRTGPYAWGIGGMAPFSIPLELLCSVRDVMSLSLLDGFLVPDTMLHYVKYKAMSYVFSKDGVFHDGQRAAYCEERFEHGVLAVMRFLESTLGSLQPLR